MSEPSSARETSRALGRGTGLFAAMAVLMCGQGLLGAALGLRAEHEHFATGVTSVVMSCYYVGFLLGARLTSFTIPRVGRRTTFIALAGLNAVVPIVHGAWVHPVPWGAGRVLTGVAMAGTYVVVESWLNDLASNDVRGRMLAVYMVVSMAGVTLGQLLLNVASPDDLGAFVASSALFGLGVLPLLARPPGGEGPEVHASMSFAELARLVPSGMVATALAGVMWGGQASMAAVYASRIGFDTHDASIFVAVGTVGTVVLSWPVNAWSDRRPRREVIVRAALMGAAIGVALMVVGSGRLVVYPLFLLFTGLITSMYSLASVYTNDWLSPDRRVAAASALVLSLGLGSILGPLAVGASMTAVGPKGYYATLTVALVVLAAYIGHRILVAPDPVAA